MLTRKDYKAIAEIIERCSGPDSHHNCRTTHTADLVKDLATYFAYNNPNFKENLFVQACGIEPEPELDEQELLAACKHTVYSLPCLCGDGDGLCCVCACKSAIENQTSIPSA